MNNNTILKTTEKNEEEKDDTEFYLIILIIEVGLILIYNLIKICSEGYRVHNKIIIAKHENESISPRANS